MPELKTLKDIPKKYTLKPQSQEGESFYCDSLDRITNKKPPKLPNVITPSWTDFVNVYDLREEAKKWVKSCEISKQNKTRIACTKNGKVYYESDNPHNWDVIREWIKHFFNIEDKDGTM